MIAPEEYLCVLSRVDTFSIDNSMYPSLKVKDAIVDRIEKKSEPDPTADAKGTALL